MENLENLVTDNMVAAALNNLYSQEGYLDFGDDETSMRVVKDCLIAAISVSPMIKQYEEEIESYHHLTTLQSKLLSDTVKVLRGTPPANTLWSHHDVAELAEKLMKEKKVLQRKLNEYRALANSLEGSIHAPDSLKTWFAGVSSLIEEEVE
jgi:hypothetical protein